MKTESFAKAIFKNYEVRFTRREKDAFLKYCQKAFKKIGYQEDEITVQETKTSKNLIIGSPDAEILITAHYDTPGRGEPIVFANPLLGQTLGNIPFLILVVLLSRLSYVPLLLLLVILMFIIKNKHNHNDNTSGILGAFNLASQIINNPVLKKKCAIILFDNEEKMLLGSAAYKKLRKIKYPDKKYALVFNLDCIGVGDTLLLAVTKEHALWHQVSNFMLKEKWQVEKKRSQSVFMSDHALFPNSVYFAMAKKSKLGYLYLPNIHTNRDTECDIKQINRLSKSIYKYLLTNYK